MIYLYAFTEDVADLESLPGIDGERLTVLTVQALAVVAGAVTRRLEVAPATLAAQDRVVRTLHDRAQALLPVRFGTAFASLEDLAQAVAPRAAALREQLAWVRGRDQMTIRVTRPALHVGEPRGEPPPPCDAQATDRGRRYLEARRARLRPPEIEPLARAAAPWARDARIEAGAGPLTVATVHHLIDRGGSEAYRNAVSAAAAGLTGLRVSLRGPLPCYAFT